MGITGISIQYFFIGLLSLLATIRLIFTYY